jgi:hypothetical protein
MTVYFNLQEKINVSEKKHLPHYHCHYRYSLVRFGPPTYWSRSAYC